ncbi:uncharacterized protein EDC62_2186 [Tibeticola sediminis]|jgi:uncharacterized protein|uniref:Xcc1710-like domain-containing protein n=1 Tax=Tibeticola sediminis TaxID=1917811 RepID=A0A3N4UTS1_9BURK|nr:MULTISPECIES: Mth938-like domain-containing protein [Tibeticola]MCI4440439.1 Mth938-like domain-containing protein [Tibeticola sp.]RPE65060.1 uncharacterized protein EDC62_2186 [Tibeticola sediminis]
MKFTADRYDVPIVTGYGPDWIAVDGERIDDSVLISSLGAREAWNCAAFEQLEAQHFETLQRFGVELVIFGSGLRQRFPHPQWLAGLYRERIGVETMDTRAACRTYNILAGEGRKVLLAALIERVAPPGSP